MAVEIDAMGKACPMPVVLAKQALDGGENDVTVVVDNQIAVENLTRLAESQGMTAQSAQRGTGFAVRITGVQAFAHSRPFLLTARKPPTSTLRENNLSDLHPL